MPYFLPELVSDILHRLPVKSLLRFRSLSTSYCTEIDGAEFAKCQPKKSIKSKTGRMLLISNHVDVGVPTDFFYADIDSDNMSIPYPRNNPLKCERRRTVVYGSCNGLILSGITGDGETKLALWNPFTKRYKRIPLCPVQTLPLCGFKQFIGLGYHSDFDEYKIVWISKPRNRYAQVWVYSLNSNSWQMCTTTGDVLLANDRIITEVGSYADGVLYWELASQQSEIKIVGFDLAKEKFFNAPALSGWDHTVVHDTLLCFGGNVYAQKHVNGTIEYYRLMRCDKPDEVGENYFWVKEFECDDEILQYRVLFVKKLATERRSVLKDAYIPPQALALSKQGDIVLFSKVLAKEKSAVFWYKFGNKTKQLVEMDDLLDRYFWDFYVCQESLVSPGRDSALDCTAEEVIIYEDSDSDSDSDSD